jgi:hypothetical protein
MYHKILTVISNVCTVWQIRHGIIWFIKRGMTGHLVRNIVRVAHSVRPATATNWASKHKNISWNFACWSGLCNNVETIVSLELRRGEKCNVFLFTTMKTDNESTCKVPLILNLGTRWREVVNFPRPLCSRERTPSRGLDGPQNRPARFEKIKICCPYRLAGPGSSVGIATGYGLDGPGIESQWGRYF